VKEGGKAKVLEGEEEMSLGIVALRSEEAVEEGVVTLMLMITHSEAGQRKRMLTVLRCLLQKRDGMAVFCGKVWSE